MPDEPPADYLAGLPEPQREALAEVNTPGLAALRQYLDSGEAVAFLGAGASASLYPLWGPLIAQLIDVAATKLTGPQSDTYRALARDSPEQVVEILRWRLGPAVYREVLREVLRPRADPISGRSWTPVHELVCRCAFKGIVTTNYDSGIVDARMRVRRHALATGFTTWEDELGLDEWRTGNVFADTELPVLYAHGQYNRPDSVVLATTEYRRAYGEKLAQVLSVLMDAGHLVWIGFSFADQRIAAILREVAQWSGTKAEPGAAPKHVVIMPWDPAGAGNDPGTLAQWAEISCGARVVLYPAADGGHHALEVLLSTLVDPEFPAAADLPAPVDPPLVMSGAAVTAIGGEMPARWMPGVETVPNFTGRAEELARLNRWARDPQVRLVGVTAWGGAGKTALVNHWVRQEGGAALRPGIRGVFGWSFYAEPSADRWAAALLDWGEREFGVRAAETRPTAAVLTLLRAVPLLLVLDGLEVAQEGPAGDAFGRLLDGTLREVLSGSCRIDHAGLILLTGRFPFADLETFDGSSARMLEVPPFTPTEGSALLAAAGADWLGEPERHSLVRAVDGHALAVGVLAGMLADRTQASDLAALLDELASAARTSARVGRVLRFYAERLSEPDRYLIAAVSLFARPVQTQAVLAVARHEAFGRRLTGWTTATVETAVRDRLGGLLSLHPDGTVSAHPLVRDAFRPLVTEAAQVAVETTLTGVPEGKVASRADALRVVEAIELLLAAGQWRAADDLYRGRAGNGDAWKHLPAARFGQRASTAFVATPTRREACATHLTPSRLGFYLNAAGLHSMNAGDLAMAREHLPMSVGHYRAGGDARSLSIALQNLAECLGNLGDTGPARAAAAEALAHAGKAGDRTVTSIAHAYRGWLAGLCGDTAEAESQFAAADQIVIVDDGRHLYSLLGNLWADWLARTGRPGPAQVLTQRNQEVCTSNGWNGDLARCERLLGRLALHAGDAAAAGEHLAVPAKFFRNGDYLTELAVTLVDLADQARISGDLESADSHAGDAVAVAAPRELVLAQSAALTARARVRCDQHAATGDPDSLAQGRDAADAALRLATRHHLAWCELDALRAHMMLDRAAGSDRGWAARADVLHARLMPPGLDSDPLANGAEVAAPGRARSSADTGNQPDGGCDMQPGGQPPPID